MISIIECSFNHGGQEEEDMGCNMQAIVYNVT